LFFNNGTNIYIISIDGKKMIAEYRVRKESPIKNPDKILYLYPSFVIDLKMKYTENKNRITKRVSLSMLKIRVIKILDNKEVITTT